MVPDPDVSLPAQLVTVRVEVRYAENMTYIHGKPGWPDFTWNSDKLSSKLSVLRYRQGELLGRMKALGVAFRTEASLHTLTEDVVKSSAIEGEKLNPDEVRSSLARHLGIETGGLIPAGRDVEAIVEMMLDAAQNHHKALTSERLYA